MEATIIEWLNLLVRWVHAIAAIMWVGDSFLFMWLDSHLTAPSRPREGTVVGELWMVHSGGFYEVVKRKSLGKDELPSHLYWFKWESYTTWISGFMLLSIVYYLNGGVFLVDEHSPFTPSTAVLVSLTLLASGVFIYDTLWRILGDKHPGEAKFISWMLLAAAVPLITWLFPGRAAFLHVGALIGTVMAGNVFFRIIPAQQHMMAQTRAGLPVDTSYGMRAKQRSTHNHYLTLPVLFTMLSNHFPSTYGNSFNWAVLLLLMVFGASLKYFMNYRLTARKDVVAVGGLALMGVVSLSLATVPREKFSDEFMLQPSPSFTRVGEILSARCLTCHSTVPSNPSFPQPPLGIVFEDPKRIQALVGRIYARAVATKTMPLGNLTGMTEDERKVIGSWAAHGASIDGATGKLKNEGPPPPALVLTGTAADSAKTIFATRCVTCHGFGGRGDGPTGSVLTPRPRDFTSVAWQKATPDEDLRKIIARGGAAVGKSPLMPANPDFADNRPVLDEVVKMVRSFEGGLAPSVAPCPDTKPAVKLPPPEAARQIFTQRCSTCHGAGGHGDGPTAAGFPVKPRNFTDPSWQAGVTDDALRKVIAKGGAAVGKNQLMPHNPDLEADPALLEEMVKIVRGFGKPAGSKP